MIRLGRYQNLSCYMVQKGLSRFDEGLISNHLISSESKEPLALHEREKGRERYRGKGAPHSVRDKEPSP